MEFTVDFAKWRCGGEGSGRLGIGPTRLLNRQGYMDVLGQCELAFGKVGLRDKVTPADKYKKRKPDTENPFVYDRYSYVRCSGLSEEAMDINDDESTSPKQKMKLLNSLFKGHGHKINWINVPGERKAAKSD